jgi:hypothetical protein
MPPRPELSEELGIPYRRIPVLAIGRDVFIDTSLISTALEKYFPESKGHPTIFPKRNGTDARDTGLIKAFVSAYADRTFFTLASLLLPWESLPEAFVKDRSAVSISSWCFYEIAHRLNSTKVLPSIPNASRQCNLQ